MYAFARQGVRNYPGTLAQVTTVVGVAGPVLAPLVEPGVRRASPSGHVRFLAPLVRRAASSDTRYVGPEGVHVEFTVSTRPQGAGAVIEVAGDLDMSTTPRLRERLREVVEGGARVVVVDLAGVGFMDSSGLGALVVAYRELRERNGWLGLAGVRRSVRTVLSITSVDQVIDIFDTVHDAEAAARAA
ncbi:STAS domain-containing protein [Micromonospora humidisoli]|uniref:STAS domain-containing protein n=1 Tax=Micromonospora sp. AKA109 TaxID=2733865 RepID=UPI0035B5751C